MNIRTSITLALMAAGSLAEVSATETSSISTECRGVAAGTVAAMRASGELSDASAVEAAVIAARRACAAALEEFGGQGGGSQSSGGTPATGAAPAQAATVTTAEAEKDDEPTIWDLLTRDRDLKPGNERLRRLKTQ